jgi:hypothetical protein
MSNTFKLFIAIWVLSTLALAQHQSQPAAAAKSGNPDFTTACDVKYDNFNAQNGGSLCVTENGNITDLSLNGLEMIGIGEGYGICDTSTGTSYFDYATQDSGNWNPATLSVKGNVVTVKRETSDGAWKLIQTITNILPTASGPGSAKVSMALKNLTGTDRVVDIMRYADLNVGSSTDFNFDFTQNTAFGLNPQGLFSGHGFSITNNTFNSAITQTAFDEDIKFGPEPCNAGEFGAPQPFTGAPGSIVMFWFYNAAHGATQTLVSTYKPI